MYLKLCAAIWLDFENRLKHIQLKTHARTSLDFLTSLLGKKSVHNYSTALMKEVYFRKGRIPLKGIFCQHKSTFHKETVDEIRVTAIPFYMGFDESEITHWVSDAQFFLSNCKVHFWCIKIYFFLLSEALQYPVEKIWGNKL